MADTRNADTRNDVSGQVGGPVVQAHRIDRVVFGPPDQLALAGLPPADVEFTGRRTALADLAAALRPDGSGPSVVVTALAGSPGVGKTALAVRAAHDAVEAGWFPGGVLFANLAGYSEHPVEPDAALSTFLRALGVSGEHIPPELPAREALYRSRLAEREPVLIVLDNASAATQVRPLLPNRSAHRVLVTSRHTLADLSGARQVEVAALDERDAVDLVGTALRTRRAGDERASAEPAAVRELCRLCGCLPLALSVLSATPADDPGQPVSELVGQLRNAVDRLGEFAYGTDLSVRAAFDLSYARLSEPERRLFRLLAGNPGPQVSVEAAAALAGLAVPEARRLLLALRRAHLLLPGKPRGWYLFHDLLRLYAEHRAAEEESAADREAALARLLDHYVTAVRNADVHLKSKALRHSVSSFFAALKEALAWLEVERENVVSAISLGRDDHTIELALALSDFLAVRAHWADWASTHLAALDVAVRTGRRMEETVLLNRLGMLMLETREYDRAGGYTRRAHELGLELGDRQGQAAALTNFADLALDQHDFDEAERHCLDALAIFEEIGNRYWQAGVQNRLGALALWQHDFPLARRRYLEAAAIYREVATDRVVAHVLSNLGNLARLTGEFAESFRYGQRALVGYRQFGDRHGEAKALYNLGILHERVGQVGRARACWEQAATAFVECGDQHSTAEVRRCLAALGGAAG
ncbi:tetratricopeptide repeat protein [Solihabitans fulvus]|uniref:Tetratricopeptide repeat protein n=1 Tax=Solihabitans fulvus TaxID=1892852 RepID=A0A5B2XAB1_9PSEU|nr:tetratricopeptide repeat protein [Solihabitans fulvus]KAA2260154.1 tetratricopeptide repeat protein [Solihabitans fulvus]